MNRLNLVALVVSLGVGVGVLVTNYKRPINRAFFWMSVNVAAWLVCLTWLTLPANPQTVLWLRITSAVSGFFPLSLWVIKDCAKGSALGWGSLLRGWFWSVLGAGLALLCFSEYFIPSGSTPEHHLRGFGWTVYVALTGLSFVVLLGQAMADLRLRAGIQKIELQILILGGSAAGLGGVILSTAAQVLEFPALARFVPFLIVAFYSATAWGITTEKIFDARHLIRTGFQQALLIGIVAAIIAAGFKVDPEHLSRPVVVIVCALIISVLMNQFNRMVARTLQRGSEKDVEAIRQEILDAGKDDVDTEVLLKRFCGILARWAGTGTAHVAQLRHEVYKCQSFALGADSQAAREIVNLGWATPESLQRQREGGGRHQLGAFMGENGLGLVVYCSCEEGVPPFLLALEVRGNRVPYTWAEVQMLRSWASAIETIFARIQFTQKALESEQLRTAGLLGASLAHEIRNPLVTLKTIAQSARARYNDPEFKRLLIELVPTEIERIEGLVSGLMDLGRPQQPHFETLKLNQVVETSTKLVRPKALDEAVVLNCRLDAEPDEINADRAYIRQIILNLVMNAIQAVATIQGERRVTVSTCSEADCIVLEVSDNGPGIPSEVRARMFQPFTTSNKTSGIGLGLAITADIVKLHRGTINLVSSPELGTTFRVSLPCRQPIS